MYTLFPDEHRDAAADEQAREIMPLLTVEDGAPMAVLIEFKGTFFLRGDSGAWAPLVGASGDLSFSVACALIASGVDGWRRSQVHPALAEGLALLNMVED